MNKAASSSIPGENSDVETALARALDPLRQRLVDRVLIAACWLGFPALVAGISRAWTAGLHLTMILQIALWAVAVAVTLFRRRLPFTIRAVTLVGVLTGNGLLGMITWGLLGTGLLLVLVGGSLSVFLWGARIGTYLGGCFVLAVTLVGMGITRGILPVTFNVEAYVRALSSWTTAIVVFTLCLTLVILAGAWLHQALNRALREATQSGAESARAQESHKQLATAVEQAAEAIIITDVEGSIVYVNPAFTRITGYGSEEVLGKSPNILKSGRHEPSFYEGLWKTVTAGETWSGHFINRKKNGDVIEEEASVSPLYDSTGQLSGFVAVSRDVTQEVRLHEQLRHSQKMEAVGLLAAGIAHDFNNLLTPILAYSDLLRVAVTENSGQRESAEEIYRAADRAKNLTRQLLTLGRRAVLEFRPTDLNNVVSDFTGILRRTIREDIEIRMTPAVEPAIVLADTAQLEQVLMNLAVNAQDAMHNGGILSISIADSTLNNSAAKALNLESGRYWRLTVADSGTGMSPAAYAHAFEPFFTTKQKGKGTGLGLATVHGIVAQHNGGISLESTPDVGTVFRLFFPAIQEQESGLSPAEAIPAAISGGSETVLVVEDDDPVRRLTCRILSKHGYQVLEADSADACLELLGDYSGALQLLLTDVVMPGSNGRELYSRLSGDHPGLRVIYMSGYSEEVISRRGVLEEGVVLLRKPFTEAALLQIIRRVLDSEDF